MVEITRAYKTMLECGVSEDHANFYRDKLRELNDLDEGTFNHSIRVADKCHSIGKEYGLDLSKFYTAALAHDFGKLNVDSDLVRKKSKYTDEDHAEMQDHVRESYEILKDVCPFIAAIAAKHHSYQENGYTGVSDDEIPEEMREKCDEYSKLLSMADCYDAMISRTDGRNEGEESLEAKFEKFHPNDMDIFNDLRKKGIF